MIKHNMAVQSSLRSTCRRMRPCDDGSGIKPRQGRSKPGQTVCTAEQPRTSRLRATKVAGDRLHGDGTAEQRQRQVSERQREGNKNPKNNATGPSESRGRSRPAVDQPRGQFERARNGVEPPKQAAERSMNCGQERSSGRREHPTSSRDFRPNNKSQDKPRCSHRGATPSASGVGSSKPHARGAEVSHGGLSLTKLERAGSIGEGSKAVPHQPHSVFAQATGKSLRALRLHPPSKKMKD